jgi:2-polyprenyl-3-methyl-5-hydroxy-6-metoxy-1,4-benzoquinol methylase
MRTVDQYVLRVLADRWAAPTRTPSLLDVSRSGNGMAEEMARVGFRVTRITLEDWSLETVNERLAGLSRHFDAVVCREVLELVDDWRETVGRHDRIAQVGGRVRRDGLGAERDDLAGKEPHPAQDGGHVPRGHR